MMLLRQEPPMRTFSPAHSETRKAGQWKEAFTKVDVFNLKDWPLFWDCVLPCIEITFIWFIFWNDVRFLKYFCLMKLKRLLFSLGKITAQTPGAALTVSLHRPTPWTPGRSQRPRGWACHLALKAQSLASNCRARMPVMPSRVWSSTCCFGSLVLEFLCW